MIPDCIERKTYVCFDAEEDASFEKSYCFGWPLCFGRVSGEVVENGMTISIENLLKLVGHINYIKVSSGEHLSGKDLSMIDCIQVPGIYSFPGFTYIPVDGVHLNNSFFEKNVLFVTAFKDIKRGDWGRPVTEYFSWYEHLKKAVSPLVCFSDHVEGAYPFEEGKTFFSLIDRDRECMESQNYKEAMAHRLSFPEHSRPEYTSMTHTKVNFVARAARMFPDYSHYIWIDFGYFRSEEDIPAKWLLAPLLGTRIHFALFDSLPFFNSPKEICQSGSNFIQGGMFIVPRDRTDWLELRYRCSLDAFFRDGFADDEQAIFLHIQSRFPKVFQFHKINEWFGIRKLYSLKKSI